MKKLLIIPILLISILCNAQFTKGGGTFLKTGSGFMTAPAIVEPQYGPDELHDGHTVAWYVYDEDVSVTEGYVTQWNDISGNNHHLTPVAANGSAGTADNRPAWHTDNGIIFDGSNDAMESIFTWGNWGTIYVVANILSYTTDDVLFGYRGTASAAPIRLTQASSTLVLRMGGAAGTNNGYNSWNSWCIIRVVMGGSNPLTADLIVNEGSPSTSTGTGTMVSTGILLAASSASAPAVYRWGNIAFKEIIYRDIEDSSVDEETIYDYLYAKYFE